MYHTETALKFCYRHFLLNITLIWIGSSLSVVINFIFLSTKGFLLNIFHYAAIIFFLFCLVETYLVHLQVIRATHGHVCSYYFTVHANTPTQNPLQSIQLLSYIYIYIYVDELHYLIIHILIIMLFFCGFFKSLCTS